MTTRRKFIPGMRWVQYQLKPDKGTWMCGEKVYSPNFSKWGKGCEVAMARWLQ